MTKIAISISCIALVFFTSCTKPSIDYNDFEWVYHDKQSMRFGAYSLEGPNCMFLVLKDSSRINVKSECLDRCVVLNGIGEVVDSCQGIDKSKLLGMRKIEGTPKFRNRYEIIMTDTSLVSNLKYQYYMQGNMNLLTREMPDIVRIISFEMDGEEYSFKLQDVDVLLDIYQYDSKRILISTRSNFPEFSAGRLNNYVLCIDLEKMTKRRLFGIFLE